MKKGYKSCPYCGEEIRKIAKKCRFCGEFLEDENSDIKQELDSEKNMGEYTNINKTIYSKKTHANKKNKNITCGKRFGKYILYLLRDWCIYAIFRTISSDVNNNYEYSFGLVDFFICFILFVFETVRLITDCKKIKKGTYGSYTKEENGNTYTTKFGKRLLCFIPNTIIIFTYISLFIGFVGNLFPLIDNYDYTNPVISSYIYSTIILTIIIGLFMALFIPTKNALYSLSGKCILWCLILATAIYIYSNDKVQHQLYQMEMKSHEYKLENSYNWSLY